MLTDVSTATIQLSSGCTGAAPVYQSAARAPVLAVAARKSHKQAFSLIVRRLHGRSSRPERLGNRSGFPDCSEQDPGPTVIKANLMECDNRWAWLMQCGRFSCRAAKRFSAAQGRQQAPRRSLFV